MRITVIALGIATVAGMATGQILFKLAAGQGSLSGIVSSPVLWAALVLYFFVALFWVLLLREVELSRAYPLIALTYVLVPIGSVLYLGEQLGPFYGWGVLLIVAGIVLTIWA